METTTAVWMPTENETIKEKLSAPLSTMHEISAGRVPTPPGVTGRSVVSDPTKTSRALRSVPGIAKASEDLQRQNDAGSPSRRSAGSRRAGSKGATGS